jgi:hypothetical protein
MSLSPEEMVTKYPVHIWYNDHHKEMSVDVLLPNLRFKNKNIVFIFKHHVKVKVNEKFEYKYEQVLDDLSLTGTFFCKDTKLNCKIYEEELEDGLKVNIKYIDNVTIHRGEIQKFARAIEAKILGINLMDDYDSDEDDYSNIYEPECEYIEKEERYDDEYNSIYEQYYEEDHHEEEYDGFPN